MKTITSLSKLLFILIAYLTTDIAMQAQVCNAPSVLPIVLTELNGTQHSNVNDGITDVITLSLCGNFDNNIGITSPFAEIAGGVQTRLYQIIQTDNATLSSYCNNCQTLVANFVPPNLATARIINPLIPGSVTISWIPWVDTDNGGDIDIGECVGDTIRWIFNLQDTQVPDLDCSRSFTIALESELTCDTFLYLIPDYFDFCSRCDNGLINELNPALWTTSATGQGTPMFNFFAPDSLRIRGSQGGASGGLVSNSDAMVCHTFNCSGTFSFSYNVRKTGIGAFGTVDRAYYTVNGNVTNLTPNVLASTASGAVTINVNAGDVFCFWVQSNNAGSATILVANNFIYKNFTIVQTMGPKSNSAPGLNDGDPFPVGEHQVQFLATDCGGNTATCVINVTVTDTPPTIDCPDNMTILLDTMDCDRVFCYNVTAEDNCPNTNLEIMGYQFIGIHNGNSYFISPPGVANHLHWLDANNIAAQLGGHLVTVADAAENNFLLSNIPFVNPLAPGNGLGSNQYWMGLRYSPMLNQFKWTTEEPFSYANWGVGQPGIVPGQYVWFLDFSITGTWWDSPSLLFRRHIIEFENGLQTKLISGIPSGGEFPPGITTNVYEVEDAFGQTATCSFTVNVLGSTQLSCKNINVSLDANCTALITPAMLLTGEYNCYDVFEVKLSHYNHPVTNPVDTHWLNKKVIATVTDTTTGNSCWSEVLIEDKLAPSLICGSDTIDCYRFAHDLPLKYTGYDCSRYTVTASGDITEHLDCDEEYLKRVYRNIKITDDIGNETECTDTILVERIKAGDIFLPLDDSEVLCSDKFEVDGNGHPHPSVTGYPYFISEGQYISVSNPTMLIECHLWVGYSDYDLGEIGCVRKIMRTWTIREWWCNTEITRSQVQLILVRDNVGPEITHVPYNFNATTGHKGCYANVNLPPIEATDLCHDIFRYDVIYPGGTLINKNGGLAQLPVGIDSVFYRVYDKCYNVTEDTLIVTVADDTEPIAVCDRRTVVSINLAGYNWIPAEVFDDGSFDECGLHHFEVRRMDRDACELFGEDDWGPEVGFCCEDVGKMIMVALKVIDKAGNEAICMVTVEVQDKNQPKIKCPPHIDIDCRFSIDLNNLGNSFGRVAREESMRDTIVIDPRYWYEIYGHPFDGVAYDNCGLEILEDIDTSGMNQCGMGLIIRKFIARDQQGASDSCYQHIRIDNHFPMSELSINWPEDFETTNICDPGLLRPELLSAPYNVPTFFDDECSLVGMDYEDHIFSSTVPGDPCYKIFREWKVIDWCYRDRLNNIVIFRDTQIIKVNNTIDPVITKACRDTTICSYDVECRPIPVTLSIAAQDFCTNSAELLFRYKIDLNSDGTFDINYAAIGNPVASGTWPLGRHIIKWEVEDRCGNTATCQSQLNLLNCKPPTAYSHKDLAIGLTGMDTNGDGAPDTKMAIIWASDLDAGSNHNCGYPIKFSFSSDTNDIRRVYTCDSIGPRNVELWVTDPQGNTSFVKTIIIINDNPQQDPRCPGRATVNVSGLLHSLSNEKVEYVDVNLDNSQLVASKTNYEGEYSFPNMPTGGSYIIRPFHNEDWLNGISTADIVRIQKHILGKETFTSPYQMIAADVNKSGTITSADIAELRKLILGSINSVDKNTSWRFVLSQYSFNSVENALKESFPETFEITNLNNDVATNFIGIKVGDLNNNAKTRGANSGIKTRSAISMDLAVENIQLNKEEIKELSFICDNISELQGFQFTIEMDPSLVEIIGVQGNTEIGISEDHFNTANLHKGIISVSWNGTNSSRQNNLFTLRIKSKVSGKVSDVVRISSKLTTALCVDKIGEEGKVQLRTFNGQGDEMIILQNEPNPWKNTTSVGIILPQAGEVQMTIYDINGKVFYKETRELAKSYNDWIINRDQLLHAGIYYYQVDYHSQTKTNKMIVIE
ncbi:MAG: HYR domain-containing protein [Saprospiraceae bacterium]|nr:HYR domain-containing protein [Saprospiraceae bacterium]